MSRREELLAVVYRYMDDAFDDGLAVGRRENEQYADTFKADAERYRWLRAFSGHTLRVMSRDHEAEFYETALDAAVDRERMGDCDTPSSQVVAQAFTCCGAADPPCTSFEASCKNPENYGADRMGFCPKCKQESFPFCATRGCPPAMTEPTK